MQRRTPLRAVLGLATSIALLPAGPAQAGVQEPIKTSPRSEVTPAAADGYLAWAQNRLSNSGPFNAFLDPDDGPQVRVNTMNSSGFGGGFSDDATTYVYQQVTNGNSNIKMYDVATGTRSDPPAGVNTGAWEWNPSISGDYLLFGRIRRGLSPDLWEVILVRLSTGDSTVLDSARNNNAFLSSSQVNGNFAVWYKHTPATNAHVFRYTIDTESEMRLPRTVAHNYDPGVAPDGTVYHARSGNACGANVQLVRYPEGGPAEVLVSLAPNREVADPYVFRDAMGDDHYYYSRIVCSENSNWDVYRVVSEATAAPAGRSAPTPPHRGPAAPPGVRSPAAGG